MTDGPLVVSVVEAAELLAISRGLAYELARAGQMPSLRLGRRLVVPRAVLLTWLEQRVSLDRRNW
jgi:excisionase family DNA binding protein